MDSKRINSALHGLGEVYAKTEVAAVHRRTRAAADLIVEMRSEILGWEGAYSALEDEVKDADVATREANQAWMDEREAHAETRAELAQAYEDMRKMRDEGFTGHQPRKIGAPAPVKPAPATPSGGLARGGIVGRRVTVTWGKGVTGGWSVPSGQLYSLWRDPVVLPASFKGAKRVPKYMALLADDAEARALSEPLNLPLGTWDIRGQHDRDWRNCS